MQTFFSLQNPLIVFMQNHPFWAGVACALVCVLLLLILCRIWKNRHVKMIDVTSEFGSVTVSSDAVGDLIRSLSSSIPEISLQSVHLIRKHGLTLCVAADFVPGTKTLAEVCTEFQKSALDILQAKFGVSEIKRVAIRVRKCKGKSSENEAIPTL